ncbi:hypothetical protein LCGC14_2898240, partial [marine sediment metagenome]
CMDCGIEYAVELKRIEEGGIVRQKSGLHLPGEPPPPTTPFSAS